MPSYQQYSAYLFQKAGAAGVPLSGTFELTARCNLDCRMCYIHRRANDAAALRGEWSAGQWLELASRCRDAGTLLLLLTGGEPLLRPDFREIYSGCKRLGLLLSINTNGTLLDAEMVRFLAADPPGRVNITLYGASPETYAALCGDGAAYDRVVAGIDALCAAGVLVKLNYSITPQNLADGPAIYDFARARGLAVQAASYMFPPVRACEFGPCTAERLTPEASARAQLDYERFLYPAAELRRRWELLLEGERLPAPEECQELPTERIRCRAGYSTFWVTWDGQLRPCGMMTEPSRPVTPETFAEAWQWLRAAREEIFLPAACGSCAVRYACDLCPALSYAETGQFTGLPAYLCQRTRAYLNEVRHALEES